MNILSWLRKLGMVRWVSTKAVYRTAAERPSMLQIEWVYSKGRLKIWFCHRSPPVRPIRRF
jgi:hypothetical protein